MFVNIDHHRVSGLHLVRFYSYRVEDFVLQKLFGGRPEVGVKLKHLLHDYY